MYVCIVYVHDVGVCHVVHACIEMYVCTYVCIVYVHDVGVCHVAHACIEMYVCTYVCIVYVHDVCQILCMYVSMCVCMHVCMCVCAWCVPDITHLHYNACMYESVQ
jgi:hypothetical protein